MNARHLFIDKPRFIAIYAAAILSAVPLGLLISYVQLHGWALMLPPFAVITLLTFIQERIYKQNPEKGAMQTVITTIKYVLATAWCVFCICGLSIGFLHEETLRFAFENIPYISAALVGVLAILFVLACIIEIYYIRKRNEEIKRRQFLLIDKPRIIISDLAFIAAITAVTVRTYNGLPINSAGSRAMLICNPSLLTWLGFTILQELLFLRLHRRELHITLSSIKWGLIITWTIIAPIVYGGFLLVLINILFDAPLIAICVICLSIEISVMARPKENDAKETDA